MLERRYYLSLYSCQMVKNCCRAMNKSSED